MCQLLEQPTCTTITTCVWNRNSNNWIVKIFQLDFFSFSGFQVSFPVGGIFFPLTVIFMKSFYSSGLNLFSSNRGISLGITWQIGRMHCLSLLFGGRMDFNRSLVSFFIQFSHSFEIQVYCIVRECTVICSTHWRLLFFNILALGLDVAMAFLDFPSNSSGKEPACQCGIYETQVRSLGWKDPLEKGMTTHSIFLAWRFPWREEPGGLQSKGLQRVGHNWSDLACTHGFLKIF